MVYTQWKGFIIMVKLSCKKILNQQYLHISLLNHHTGVITFLTLTYFIKK